MSFAVTIEVLIDLPDAMNRTEAELKSQRLKEFLDEIAHNVIGTEITEINHKIHLEIESHAFTLFQWIPLPGSARTK